MKNSASLPHTLAMEASMANSSMMSIFRWAAFSSSQWMAVMPSLM